jgi:hypothetical protein
MPHPQLILAPQEPAARDDAAGGMARVEEDDGAVATPRGHINDPIPAWHNNDNDDDDETLPLAHGVCVPEQDGPIQQDRAGQAGKRRRRLGDYPTEMLFPCTAAGCKKTYMHRGGLYNHVSSKHPELAGAAPDAPQAVQRRRRVDNGTEAKHRCPVEGCERAYADRGGLHNHMSSKHPEADTQRRGTVQCMHSSCGKWYASVAGMHEHWRLVQHSGCPPGSGARWDGYPAAQAKRAAREAAQSSGGSGGTPGRSGGESSAAWLTALLSVPPPPDLEYFAPVHE